MPEEQPSSGPDGSYPSAAGAGPALGPGPGPEPGPGTSSQTAKSPRVLACILCQQRKVRCDRKFPCANCVRSRVQCVPATLHPRRRRRKLTERELLERVRQYEALLRSNDINFEPLVAADLGGGDGQGGSGAPTGDGGGRGGRESDDEHADSGEAESGSTPTTGDIQDPDFWQFGKLALRETDKWGVDRAAIKEAWENFTQDSDHLLFGVRNAAVDLSTLHPEPAQLFRLWQVYLDNVDPLFKVTHTPTLQRLIAEAAGDLSLLTTTQEALMFGVYCIAVTSLADDKCQAIFASPRQDLLARFQFGCQQALQNARFLRTSERDVLTAFFLYLMSLGLRAHPQSLSSMLGIAMRLAMRMEIHAEESLANLPVLEAEMRRRLWWAFKLLDTRIGELAAHKFTAMGPGWDCRIPLNVNDSDLLPEMSRPPASLETPTEALFAVVRSELGDFVRKSRFDASMNYKGLFKHGADKAPPTTAPTIDDAAQTMENRYLQSCDPRNALHFMTMWTARETLARYRLIEYYHDHSNPGIEITDQERDVSVSYAVDMLDHDTRIQVSPLTQGYRWFTDFYFPMLAHVHLVHDLQRRPLARIAERAWEAMYDNYHARVQQWESDNPITHLFANMMLQCWDHCETTALQMGEHLAVPRLVSDIRRRQQQIADSTRSFSHAGLPSDVMQLDSSIAGSAPPTNALPMSSGMPDPGLMLQPDLHSYSIASGLSPLDDTDFQLDWAAFN
ncbi:hypothetical protein GGR56DRAFT_485552 [Xylariaceae sp. FL0804]|nr:hypothetical protein GGR56DRAFT_485552 [Xylariaceae sp. FL0804]